MPTAGNEEATSMTSAWGTLNGDVDGDMDTADLLALRGAYGPC